MISIIICSHKQPALEVVAENIRRTIGVPYELVVIENPVGAFGICEAYNRGADAAIFDTLCFMHEDIRFETPDWGQLVMLHLADKSTGLIGLAGGDSKSLVPSSWPSFITENHMHIIQHKKDKTGEGRLFYSGQPAGANQECRVACIDGVWMCTRKDVFARHRFDEAFFKGFHGYDIDYSLQVNQSYKVLVVFDILVHHYSEGSFNRDWAIENIRLSQKWKAALPFSVVQLSEKETIRQHWTCINIFLDHLLMMNFRPGFIAGVFKQFALAPRPFHFGHFIHSCRKVAYSFFGKKLLEPKNFITASANNYRKYD